uniref:Uncharacterized protein n=1 Tax=Setaria digitata TaxID=48799 RepID=A0A915PS69_9BILA
MSLILQFILLVYPRIIVVICQIDLGSFSLGQNKHGDLKVAFNQAANILGFGGDRGFDLTIGEGRFNTKARQGALIAGERIGVDSGIGINEAEGIDLGSFLNFGNSASSSSNPVNQFFSFLEGIKKFFAGEKSPNVATFSSQYEDPNAKTRDIFNKIGASKQNRISGESMMYTYSDSDDYYHNVEVEDEAPQRALNLTSDSSSQDGLK